MALVSLDEAKSYLRVDYAGEDSLIGSLLAASISVCIDVARISEEQWADIDSGTAHESGYSASELSSAKSVMKEAILYTLGYFFEHRENANHSALTLTLRSLFSGLREARF